MLHHAGILNPAPTDPGDVSPQIVAADDEQDYVMSPSSGIFEPFFELGDDIESGIQVGQVHSLEHPDRPAEPVFAGSSGILFARRSIPLTRQGECLVVITRPVQS